MSFGPTVGLRLSNHMCLRRWPQEEISRSRLVPRHFRGGFKSSSEESRGHRFFMNSGSSAVYQL